MNELWRLNTAQLAAGFECGDFTPVEALQACIVQSQAWQPHTNAFVCMDLPGAQAAARASAARWAAATPLGPLDGMPVSLKDNLHAAGLPTTWGSRLLQGPPALHDELPVARLRAAGAVIFGKTNLPEFAMQGYTGNKVVGVTRNPWNTSLTPGGSSGGAAAAVATGCGPLALCTDGGGSTRRPASHCGVVGFKPSGGVVARRGGLPEIFLDYEVVGAMGRTVHDAALLVHGAAMRSMPELTGVVGTRKARVLFVPRFGASPVDTDIASLTARAAARFSALGHEVKEAPAFTLADEVNDLWPTLSQAGLAWMLSRAASFAEFGLATGQRVDLSLCGEAAQAAFHAGMQAHATTLFDVFAAVHAMRSQLANLFEGHDFILTPAAAALPWPAHETHPGVIDGQAVGPRGHGVFTAIANAAGLPGIALPCGNARGLPVGLQLMARAGADAALLALAREYEAAHPWQDQWPAQPAPRPNNQTGTSS
ncbi:MAG: amidase [Burkholderiaceae bacterium]|nr:amidase [Burkholderiaceae bacterium]